MQTHRIRELRRAKGWSQERLASALGVDQTVISKLERNALRLRTDEAQRIAQVLEVGVEDVLGIERGGSGSAPVSSGFSDDLAPYTDNPSDPFLKLLAENQYLLRVESDALSERGIWRGHIVVVDGSAAVVAKVKDGDLVRVQHHPDPANPAHALSLMRQFVQPNLLITNSETANAPVLNMKTDDAQILGVIVSHHRALQS